MEKTVGVLLANMNKCVFSEVNLSECTRLGNPYLRYRFLSAFNYFPITFEARTRVDLVGKLFSLIAATKTQGSARLPH